MNASYIKIKDWKVSGTRLTRREMRAYALHICAFSSNPSISLSNHAISWLPSEVSIHSSAYIRRVWRHSVPDASNEVFRRVSRTSWSGAAQLFYCFTNYLCSIALAIQLPWELKMLHSLYKIIRRRCHQPSTSGKILVYIQNFQSTSLTSYCRADFLTVSRKHFLRTISRLNYTVFVMPII